MKGSLSIEKRPISNGAGMKDHWYLGKGRDKKREHPQDPERKQEKVG